MAKIKKKGTTGQAKNFITRTQAVRKLQISLPDFRRLCIFKGIYPREPRNKKKASKSSTPSTTFYYTKDIQYLLHEPLLNKFREHKALSKKIARSLGRGEVGDAARLEKTGTPKISLDHIIKERYPTFVDALRDLDDALSMLFLFANLPSTSTVPPKTIALCQRLCLEFEHYLITTHSLRKSFLSIKGIYYQATIQGQDILWLVPYKFVQRVTGDVDFRIMGTFVEFYTTLLGFVNFRLYTSIGLIYPPKFNASSDEKGGELGAFTLEGRGVTVAQPELEAPQPQESGTTSGILNGTTDIQAQVDSLANLPEPEEEQAGNEDEAREEVNNAIDKFETTGPDADVLPQPQSSGIDVSTIFAPYTFFLSRETPRQPLEFLLRAFGCKRIGWDTVLGDGAFTHNEADTTITHQIVDRPPLPQDALPIVPDVEEDAGAMTSQTLRPGSRVPGRTYIQPQWVWDCVNGGKLLRPDLYAPGATLPPHLSPWVKSTKGAYDPGAPLAEQEREGEAEEAMEEEEEEGATDEEEEMDAVADSAKAVTAADETAVDGEMAVAGSDDDDDDDNNDANDVQDDEFAGFSDAPPSSEDEAETLRTQHQRELEAEASGLPFSGSTGNNDTGPGTKGNTTTNRKGDEARKKAARKRRQDEEELERQKMMMSRKKRKVLDKMLYSNRKKDEEAERLRGKRRKIERVGG
ncbi:MAG: mRNA-binding ribosome synthesis protein nop7 [Pleopsidium flavum]|nr:MAG: mRNA-binding ribosome synthesis protein nop7 [Pleopsidium flavum]